MAEADSKRLGLRGAAGTVMIVLAVVAFLSLLAAGSALVRLYDQRKDLGARQNEAMVFIFHQLGRELGAVELAVAERRHNPEGATTAQLQEAFDILYSRVETVEGSALVIRLPPGSQLLGDIRAMKERVLAIAPQFDALAEGPALETSLARLGDQLAGLRMIADEVVMRANQSFNAFRQETREATEALLERLTVAILSLVGSFLLLGTIAVGQYRAIDAARWRAIEMQSTLEAAATAAQAATVAKSAFLATMSHEIRTPMNGVIGAASLLTGTRLDDNQRRLLGTIQSSGSALLTVIDDILDFSKIEAGRMQIEFAEFDPRALVETVTTVIATAVRDRGIDFVAVVDADVPARLNGDVARLRQVLLNLLSNAVKFTEAGGVGLRLRVTRDEEAGEAQLFCQVDDSGIGIPESARDKLFQEFSQVDASTSRRFGGSGLGLAICRRIVERLGGRIGLESEVGRGSRFWFALPLRAAAEAPPPVGLGGGRRAQVAGGNHVVRAALEALLASQDFTVMPAETPMRGGGLLLLRNGEAAPAGLSRAVGVLRFGPGAGLDSPMTAARLAEALAPETPVTGPAPIAPIGKPARPLAVLVAEDNQINQDILCAMLRHLGHVTTVACNGAEAVAAMRAQPDIDLVLMDMQMPVMSGTDASRAIRALDGKAARVPIVAVTANAFDSDWDACREAGMDRFLPKPITIDGLTRVIGELMEALPPGPAAAPEPPGALDGRHRAAIAALMSPDALDGLIGAFWAEAVSSVGQLRLALDAGDRREADLLLHTMKGSAGNLGYSALAAAAQAMRAALDEGGDREAAGTSFIRTLYAAAGADPAQRDPSLPERLAFVWHATTPVC